jgi:hypothetical protein
VNSKRWATLPPFQRGANIQLRLGKMAKIITVTETQIQQLEKGDCLSQNILKE